MFGGEMVKIVRWMMAVVMLTGLACGCVSNSAEVFARQQELYAAGKFAEAATYIRENRDMGLSSKFFLDWVGVGSADFSRGEFKSAYEDFANSEECIHDQDTHWKDAFSTFGRDLRTQLFEGETYYMASNCDESMVNLYKAFAKLGQGDIESARVEFNRCAVRQERSAARSEELMGHRAVQYGDRPWTSWKRRSWNWDGVVRPYRPRVEVNRKGKIDYRKQLLKEVAGIHPNEPPSTFEQVEALARCSALPQVAASYKDYQFYDKCSNPAVWFCSGAYRLIFGDEASDWNRGLFALRQAAASVPAQVTQKAVSLLDARAEGKFTGDQVCVIFENGLGSVLQQQRIEIEVNTLYPVYKGVVLPGFVQRTADGQRLNVSANGIQLGTTESICDVDRMVGAETRQYFDDLANYRVWSAKIRIASDLDSIDEYRAQLVQQYAQQVQQGLMRAEMVPSLVATGITAYGQKLIESHMARDTVDVRMWSSLPRDFQAIIVPRPEAGNLVLTDAVTGSVVAELALPAVKGSVFVYVKKVVDGIPPTIVYNIKRR